MIFELLVTTPEVMAVGRTPLVTVGYIFQLLISLAIVVGLIYVSMKYVLPKIQIPSTGKMIEVVERIGLEPQVSAYIISSFGKRYIVVVSSKSVTLIDKIESGS